MTEPDVHASSKRVADLLQVLTIEHPVFVIALERFLRTILEDDRRRRIAERLERLKRLDVQRLDPDHLAAFDALFAQLDRPPRDPATHG